MDAIEKSSQNITEVVKQMDAQMSTKLQGFGGKMDSSSIVTKAGFAEMGEKIETSNNDFGDRFERTLTTSIKAMSQDLQGLIRALMEQRDGKTEVQPSAAAPAQNVSIKHEPAHNGR